MHANDRHFPFFMPGVKPDRPLSEAVARNYDGYESIRPEQNELYSQFKYTKLPGFDYHGGDGTVTRRDPSKVIFANGKYYIWYTHRNTDFKSVGMRRAAQATDKIPSADWDLSDIYYATSKDGFTWEEQGVAVARPPKPQPGWRSVTTRWDLSFPMRLLTRLMAEGSHGAFPISSTLRAIGNGTTLSWSGLIVT